MRRLLEPHTPLLNRTPFHDARQRRAPLTNERATFVAHVSPCGGISPWRHQSGKGPLRVCCLRALGI